jgi:hypothetical protein
VADFRDYKNKYAGETAWVLGSGKTLDFVPNGFFSDKLVVATNVTFRDRIGEGFACSNYWMSKDNLVLPTVMPEQPQVPDEWRTVKQDSPLAIYVPTIPQKYSAFDAEADWPENETFVVGPSSIHLSLHWAVWLGVKHIVLVGADCGFIDEENNSENYYDSADQAVAIAHAHHKLWESVLMGMANKIRSRGVSVHSLNPWVTFNLEGHKWTQR